MNNSQKDSLLETLTAISSCPNLFKRDTVLLVETLKNIEASNRRVKLINCETSMRNM